MRLRNGPVHHNLVVMEKTQDQDPEKSRVRPPFLLIIRLSEGTVLGSARCGFSVISIYIKL